MGWGKEGYQRLKALGICVNCGKHPVRPGQTKCDKCRAKMKEYRTHVKDYRPVKRKIEYTDRSDKPKPQYTLDDIAAMARQEGISYGQMVALLDRKEGRK